MTLVVKKTDVMVVTMAERWVVTKAYRSVELLAPQLAEKMAVS